MPEQQTWDIEFVQLKFAKDLKTGDVVEPVWLWQDRRIVESNDGVTVKFSNADPIDIAAFGELEKLRVVKIRKTTKPPWVF